MKLLLAVLAIVSGLGLACQTGMNGQLKASLSSAVAGAWLNFLIGVASLTVAMVALRAPFPSFSTIALVPWWAWGGGVFGAFFILVTTLAARDLGALALVVLVLAGQALGSVVVDHFGLMGLPVRPISIAKLVACVLLIFSVFLLQVGESSPQ
jgi:transporter family-2 protein